MKNSTNLGRTIDQKQAKALIDQHVELSRYTDTRLREECPDALKEEAELFIGKTHNAHAFSKKEVLALFGMESEEDTNEWLLVVDGVHTKEVHDAEHPAGSPTVVLVSVKDEDDAFRPLGIPSGMAEFPWIQSVQTATEGGKIVLKKLMGNNS